MVKADKESFTQFSSAFLMIFNKGNCNDEGKARLANCSSPVLSYLLRVKTSFVTVHGAPIS